MNVILKKIIGTLLETDEFFGKNIIIYIYHRSDFVHQTRVSSTKDLVLSGN